MNKQWIVKAFPIVREKIDVDRRTVTMQLFMVDAPDRHGDRTSKGEIANALDFYMSLNKQAIGRMHKELTNSFPQRIWQDEAGNGYVTDKVVDQKDWDGVLEGTLTGGSWAGFAYSTPRDDGTFDLTGIEMWEHSYVDTPAVQTAVFKSADGEPKLSLVEQLVNGGEVKPRVTPASKRTLRERVTAIMKSLINPTPAGGETQGDIDMNAEELKKLLGDSLTDALKPISEKVDSLATRVEGIEKAKDGPSAEGDKDDKDKDAPAALTADDISKAFAEATKPLLEQLEKIAAQPGVSQRIKSDGESTETAKDYDWKK